jgi:hypothetical protein
MFKLKYLLILLLFINFIFLLGCSSNSSNPDDDKTNVFRSHSVVHTESRQYDFNYTLSVYMPNVNMTWIVASTLDLMEDSEDSDYNGFEVGVEGTTVGSYQLNDKNRIYMFIDEKYYDSENGSGTIEITKYGGIGDYIEGTFSGTFTSGSDNINVVSASFKGYRIEDEE